MTSHCHSPFSTHTVGLGDLDLQPVREAKVRVLNDIPKEPVVPPPAPQVKFNFIDVTFPKPPQEGLVDSAQTHHGNASRSPKKRSNVGKEVNARDQVRYNKVNSYTGQAQRNMERDRREYLSQLLRRGIPMWEEVPEEERAARVIGGTNPFRHHPYSSNPTTSDITHTSTNKQKSSRIIQAVWEDVQDGSKYSYPLEHSDELIGSPRESISEAEEIDLKSRTEKLNKTLQNKSQTVQNLAYDTPFYKQSQTTFSHEHHLGGHTMPLENHERTHESCISSVTFSKELNRGEISQAHPTSQEQVHEDVEEYNSEVQEMPPQNPSENLVFREIPSPVQGGSSPLEDWKPQDGDVFEQGGVSVPVIKKIYIDQTDNNATSSISWWPGDKLYKERSKNEEEEKHEKESTKEKKGKRDLSTAPSNPQKRRHVVADQEKAEVIKPPPRVRHYEPDEVRRYMKDKQCERAKAIREQQRRQEQERIQKSERMKELAMKTKQLSHASKKGWQNPTPAGLVNQEQNQLEQQPIIVWSSHKEWRPENYSEASPLHQTSAQLKEQNLLHATPFVHSGGREDKSLKQNETKKEASQVAMVPPCPVLDEEDKYGEGDAKKAKKRNKKDGKRRKKRQSMSDSEAISDIVSRTVEECERQVKSSSVSVESLSSLSSYSCSSSDAESRSSQSESLSCSLDLTPKERVVALGQLAQKLTNKVTQKAGNLRQWEKHNQEAPDMSHKAASINIRKQVTRKLPAKNINIMSDPRASFSLSQIETMSVEELIAKMTAMLPNKSVNESRSNAPETDLQSQNINANEKQNFKNKVQTRIESMTNRYTQDTTVRESFQRALTDQVPRLVVPDVPKLKLLGVNKKVEEPQKIVQQQSPSMLPECNVEQGMKDLKSQTDEEKHIYVKMMPTHKLQDRYVLPQCERLVTGRQQDQLHLLTSTYRNCPVSTREKFDKAALVIQAAYRGYRVRKVTHSLISRRTACRAKSINKTNSFRGVPSNTQVSVGQGLNKFFKKSDSAIDGNNVSQQVLKEGREELNWREIRSELESRTLKPHRESYYVSQRSNLPGWIKPYFVLSETGDVNNFLETRMNKPEGDVDERDENRSNCSMTNQGQDNTQNHPQLVFKESVHDVTLTEGPLLDIEKGRVHGFDKETQTSYNTCLNIKGDKEGSDQNSNAAQVSSEVQKFIDLKELCRRKVISQSGENVGSVQKAKSFETLSSGALAASQSALSQEDHEDTLEEGPLEEALGGRNSFQATSNETLESGSIQPNFITEGGPHSETSGVMDSSNGSSSIIVEEASAPHELLGEGVHLGPASLRLRLNAELMYQDTLGKALNQLHNVEQLNIINRSRQEAVALSQSLALQQQKVELAAQWKNGNELNMQEKEAKRRDDYEKRLKEKLKQQEAALQKVEKIEKEARSRFAELEREVRSRAEQVIAQARVPQPSSTHSDVIAAAAVAAVGATISQWKQLRPVRGHDSHGTILQSEGPLSPKSCSEQTLASSSTPLSDKSYSGPYSVKSLSKESRSTGDKMASLISEILDENLLETSVIEEVLSGNSTNNNSEGSQVNSDIKSSQNCVPENIVSVKSSTPIVNQSTVASESFVKSNDNCFNQFNGKLMPQGAGKVLLQESEDSGSVSEKIDCASGAETRVTSGEVMSSSNIASEEISTSKYSGKVTAAVSKNVASSATKSNEVEIVSNVKSSQLLKGSSIRDDKKYKLNEPLPSKINNGSSLMSSSSKSRERERKKGENDTSDNYSGSFEVDSETEGSNTSQLQGQGQGANGGDLALVVSSGNIMNDLGYRSSPQGAGGVTAPVPGGGGEGALGATLSVVESLLREEEVHHQHQKSLLKLQEQSLIEEAKWKLATLQSEGGPGMRRRQRAIVLQLREQKAYLKRLRETQNIGAQQRRLMLLQLHHLLATTKNLSGFSSKGYLTATRGHSPNPSSPRLTPRLMEMLSSSSSDTPDDATLGLLVRGRDTDSSSPSESGGGREKRRGHSEDRLKSSSVRLHEKRRAVEIEALQQQILHEDKEILRLKVKSAYDIHDKDSVKPKRKGDFIAKRIREKKDRNTGSVSPLSVLVQGSKTSAESSLPTETMVATALDSQNSIPEEGGSEIISHSDIASSVSEQEGLTSSSHRKGNSQSKEVFGSRRVPSYGISEMETKDSFFSKPRMSRELESEAIQEQHSNKDSKVLEKSSSVKTVSSEEASFSVEERLSNEKSESSKSLEKSNAVKSEVYERNSKSQETSIRSKLSSSGSAKSGWNKPEPLIPEDVADNSRVRSASNSSWCSSETRVDCGARSSDSKLAGGKLFSQKSSNRGLPLPLKVPLSPRSLCRQHRRYSSESDDSFTLSQTETASDVSDGEGKLLALKEELAVRRAEAERLKKEKRKLRRERLASQERALRQQISTYDAYIQHARMELEKESKELQQASMVRPLIKKPQVAETKKSRLSEPLISPEKSDVSDASLVSEGSKSDQSNLSRSQEISSNENHHVKSHENIKPQELRLPQMGAVPLKNQEIISSSSSKEANTEGKSSRKETASETVTSHRENESQETSCSSSVSEILNEESISKQTQNDDSKKSPSQESSIESEHTQSRASSTETTVHSLQKLEPSLKDEIAVSIREVNAALLEVLKNNEKDDHVNSRAGGSETRIKVEGEKLEIYIPTSGFKYSEAEELVEGNTNTSAEQSICEEVFDDNFEETENESSSQEMEVSKNVFHQMIVESKMYENNNTSSSSLSENKEPSLKTKLFAETDTPSCALQAKDTLSGREDAKQAPTLDQQRLVDDISNNLLAIMMKDTSQLFTTIVKDKVNNSSASEVEDAAEAVNGSTAAELIGEASEFQKDDGTQSQHSCPIVPEEDGSSPKQNSSSKSQILQRVNELIGEGGSGSLHLLASSSTKSADVQLTSHLTFDLSPESTSPISPTSAKASKVEKDGLMGLVEGASPRLLGEETVSFAVAPSESHQEEKEHDSLSPSHDVVKAEEYKLDTDTLTARLLNLASAPEFDLEARLGQLGESTEFSVEGIEGDWFDDDFWTSSDSKKKQQQLKAEEERITAEIARLEELQHLQQQYPGLVIREVPNKPPPPYTPPQVTSAPSPGSSPTPDRPPAYTSPPTSPILPEAQPLSPSHTSSISHRLSKADQRKLAAHITQVVPITEEEALPIIDRALDTLCEARQNNIDPGYIPLPPHTNLAKGFSLSSFTEEDMHEDEKTSNRAFHLLLFCLAQELLCAPYKLQHSAQRPPWMKHVLPQARMLGIVKTKSSAGLFSYVHEQVKILFGWKPPLQKESLMIRWAQKHRDLVDQVLVKELQAEEASWTNYDEDEAAVKTKVASEILDTLLSETVALVSDILVRKLQYIVH